jgi:hypothetical protein
MCYCSHDCHCRRCTDQRNIESGLAGALLLVGGVFLAGWAIYKLGKGTINLLSSSNSSSNRLAPPAQNSDVIDAEWQEVRKIENKKVKASANIVKKIVAKKGVDDIPNPETQVAIVQHDFQIKTKDRTIKIPKGYKLNIKIYNFDPAKFRVMADGELFRNEVLLLADLLWFCDHINTDVEDRPEAVC